MRDKLLLAIRNLTTLPIIEYLNQDFRLEHC